MKITKGFQLRVKALGLYFFCTFLVYLSGAYFGRILLFLFYFFLLLPFCSLIFFILATWGVKFSQYFSTEHPVKGETIKYRVLLANELPFGISELASKFVTSNPLMEEMIPDFRLSLPRKTNREFVYDITCSYRGIYQVGLEAVALTDVLNLFSLSLPVWHRTFYVYPRIIEIVSFSFGPESYYTRGSQPALSGLPDHTLLKGISEYRRGISLRHIYWKKMAVTGIPVLKQFETATSPGIAFYLDLYNRNSEKSNQALEREDVSVEILTALVKYYLTGDVDVSVRSPCIPVFNFRGQRLEDFQDFYKKSINLFSGPYESPFRLFRQDHRNGTLESKSIVFITHRVDPDIFNFAVESVASKMRIMIIFNHTSASAEAKKSNVRFFNSLRDRGVHILEVQGPETIARDLESYRYA